MRRALYPVLFGGFNFVNFEAAQTDGFDFNFTKTDDGFQENTGPTPAQATNDVIGLKLDRRTWRGQTLAQVLAGAGEKLTPGSWSMSVNGGTGTATESPAGTLNLTGDGTHLATGDQSFTSVSGTIYRLRVTVANSAVGMNIGTTQGGSNIASSVVFNVGTTDYYFIATGTTTWIRFFKSGAVLTTVSGISSKAIPGYAATQSNSGFRPTYQSGWARFDGNDDRLGIGLLFGSKGFVMARRKLIQKTLATQVMFGAVGASGTDRLYFGVDTSGVPVGRIGNGAAMSGSGDITGMDGTIGVMWDGSNASLLVDGAQVATQTQTGTPTTTVSPTLGGYNNNGTPASFCNFDCRECVNGNSAPSAATLFNIHRALMAL